MYNNIVDQPSISSEELTAYENEQLKAIAPEPDETIITRPEPLIAQVENLPESVKRLPNWVTWRYEYRDGEKRPWTKEPYRPQGKHASSTDPKSWGTFEAAYDAYSAAEGYIDGIGLVLWPETRKIVGIDLDDCRDSATGIIDPWAVAIINDINSYSELSPSGTGIRILALGELPQGRRRTSKDTENKIEMYTRGRFLTLTGQRLAEMPFELQERAEEIARFHRETFPSEPERERPEAPQSVSRDDDLLISVASERTEEKFDQLWAGKWEELNYGSQSDADLALAGMLAHYTGADPDRIDRLFRQSGLCRDKWENRADYRERTITKALERDTYFDWETWHRIQPTVVDPYELDPFFPEDDTTATESGPLAKTSVAKTESRDKRVFEDANLILLLPDPEWLIEGILADKAFALLYGLPGCMKTFFGIDMALSLAHGLPFLDRFPVVREMPVAYITPEGTAGLKHRLKSWMEAKGIDRLRNTFINRQPFRLTEREEIAAVLRQIAASGTCPKVLFVDTLARNFGAGDENSTKDMNNFVNNAMELAGVLKCALVIIHHAGKDTAKGPRGSIALTGAVDTSIEMVKEEDGKSAIVRCRKQKDAEEFATFVVRANLIGQSLTLTHTDEKPTTDANKVERFSDMLPVFRHLPQDPAQAMKVSTLTGLTKIADTTIRRYLDLARNQGYVAIAEGSRPQAFHLTEKGQTQVGGWLMVNP